jgi:hypothetical protein
MKYDKVLRTLGIAIVLSLVTVAIPARPALAAPAIALSPTSGATGTRVTVSGTNFISYVGDSLEVFFNNVEIADSPKTVPSAGNFEAQFDVPDNAAPGTSWVTIRGPLNAVLAQSPFIVPKTEIELDARDGVVGNTVRITGRGFYSNKIVAFYYQFNGFKEKLGTAIATPVGECAFDFVIPESADGKKTVYAENAQGNSATAELVIIPSVTLSQTSGIVDDIISLSGTGFGYASEIIVYFKTSKVAYADTNQYGSFKASFRVPVMNAGVYAVRIQDEFDNVARLDFTITTDIKLDRTTGSVGTDLTVSGTGFKSGDTVDIKYDDTIIATTNVDESGAFSIDFTAPASTGGEHTVTVSDSTKTRQVAFTMESEAPPAPALLSPEPEAELKAPVSFQWQEVFDPSLPISYRLQVASDQDFTKIQTDQKDLTDTKYTMTEEEELKPSKQGAPYYWRIKAIDGASNESEWSAPGSFYIKSAAFLPDWAIIALIAFGVVLVIFIVWRLRRETRYS